MAFQPVAARFVPSQTPRGRDIAVFVFPDDHELCYEWHYQKTLANGQTSLYMCCECRAMKRADRESHNEPIPICHIRSGRFITDPRNPHRRHFCQPRSTPRAAARRLVIERCAEIRRSDPHVLRAPSVEVAEVLSRIASDGFGNFISGIRSANDKS